ncbi:hypothetical protein [Synechococcus sp. UW179B]|uniref:hypothetical protein n=1 Tax=Synechococcus sp. UW179B TaxID=2575516 RepID=UPI001A7E16B8|nr:hypothetical protein [Synechococcus sp. UW179B]
MNGINNNHKLMEYGAYQAKQMMKLVIHDPILTLTNRFDFLHPWLSGLIETSLIIGTILLIVNTLLSKNQKATAILLVLCFNLLIGVQSTTFLPPSAYPIGFSACFFIIVLGNIWFDTFQLWKFKQQIILSKSRKLRKATCLFISLAIGIAEQVAFLFYACNFFQSILLWFGLLLSNLIDQKRALSPGILKDSFISGLRYIPFIAISLVWRLNHNTGSAEALSKELKPIHLLANSFRWALGGTSLGGLSGMQPMYKLPTEMPIVIILISMCYGLLCYAMMVMSSKQKISAELDLRLTKNIPSYFVLVMGPAMLLAWCTPVLSDRYYQELGNNSSQTYVASRFAGIGLILVISWIATQLAKFTKVKSWMALSIAMLLGILISTQNVYSIYRNWGRTYLAKHSVCIGTDQWDDSYLPKDVFESHVNTRNWIPSFPANALGKSLEEKREITKNRFRENVFPHC